jgi:hypothetical protein
VAASKLLTACESLRQGRMPLQSYVILHPESKLSDDQIGEFCAWSREEARALILKARRSTALPQ